MIRLAPLVLLGIALAACRPASTPAPAVSPAEDVQPAPSAAAPDVSAIDLRLVTSQDVLAYVTDRRAPLTVVNFWATWCHPCVAEFPALMRARAALRADSVRFVFVSVDDMNVRADVLAFLARQGVRGVAFQNREADQQGFARAFSTRWGQSGTLPATFVYDHAGQQVAYFDHPVTFEAITDTARALLRTSAL